MPVNFITLEAECEYCQEEGINGRAEDQIYFDDDEYEVIRDCLKNWNHDAYGVFKWEDEKGPYLNMREKLLEMLKKKKNC